MDYNQFLRDLYGGLTGFVALATKGVMGDLDTERFFTLPKDLESGFMARYVSLRDREDLYCSVAAFSDEKRSNDDKNAMTNVVWADADLAHPDKFSTKPSIISETSPDKFHLFWLLDEPMKAVHAQELSRRVYHAHKDDGCDAGWTMTKYLRVPGTTNRKYAEEWEVKAHYSEEPVLRYTPEELQEAYPVEEVVAPEGDPEDDYRSAPAPLEVDEQEALERRIPFELREMYLTVPMAGQSWSERAMRLWCDFFREGFTDHEVYHLACHAACNKYSPAGWGKQTQTGIKIPKRPDWRAVTWAEVLKAKKLVADEKVQVVPVVQDGIYRHPETTSAEPPKFLTDRERDLVRKTPVDFLETYTSLARKFTGSAEVYHRSLGAILLASIFGESGRIDLPFMSRAPLNLWTLVIGDSTSSRKSTAYNFMRDVIASFDKGTSKDTILGSDVTSEGLTKELHLRDGEVSLVAVDEVSGLFSQMNSKKYMSGLQERLTELYDGRVPKTLRASKDHEAGSSTATTCMNLVGVGVRSALTSILTVPDFQSGFLMRMTWAVDRRLGHEKGASAIRFTQNHGEGIYFSAQERDEAIDEFARNLRVRYMRHAKKDGPTYLYLGAQAEARFNDWVDEAHAYSERTGLDFITAAVERLAMSVLKLACLMHLYNDEPTNREVSMIELLVAIKQGEMWMNDMVLMASEIGASAFEEKLNAVEDYILRQSEKIATDTQLRRKFAGLRPREFDEVMISLTRQGRIGPARGYDNAYMAFS